MNVKTNGITRVVFVFNRFVVKIPKWTYSHQHFLQGCYANWSERQYCITFAKFSMLNRVAPSYYCSFFGLFQIQAKCEPFKEPLTKEEIEAIKKLKKEGLFADIKADNLGYYKGRIVVLDYT